MNLQTIQIRWSAPIPMKGADASPIPARGGVYELLFNDGSGVERLYSGESEDLRRTFISHSAGSKGDEELRRILQGNECSIRYRECEAVQRRLEVLAALLDAHVYEFGGDDFDHAACVRLQETW